MFKSSQHKCAYLYNPDLGTNHGQKSLDLNKYINLGAIKGNQEFASYALLHITCDLYYIFSPGPFSIQPRCWMGHRGERKCTLPYLTKRKRKQGNLVMWHVMFKIAEKDHCSSNPGSNPSSNPGSNSVSKFRCPWPVPRYILTTWS